VTSLSLQDDPAREPVRRTAAGRSMTVLLAILVLLLAGMGFVGYRMVERMNAVEARMAALSANAEASSAMALRALQHAEASESAARKAAEQRQAAEVETAGARQQAAAAQEEANTARDAAAAAQAEAAAIRKKAEAEVNRLEAALGQIAETRRTALGLVMNLGEDHLKFEFNKADLRPQDREILSRIAGIILTSQDYTIHVDGHTDDVGTAAYNQALSERRAQAVRDYLVTAGLPATILTVRGQGKSLPLVKGTSEAARAKNRRVELGLVNTQIRYGK
jgi:outer membrane protein OmpA-like peptidoglycan-associated protein